MQSCKQFNYSKEYINFISLSCIRLHGASFEFYMQSSHEYLHNSRCSRTFYSEKFAFGGYGMPQACCTTRRTFSSKSILIKENKSLKIYFIYIINIVIIDVFSIARSYCNHFLSYIYIFNVGRYS